MNLIYAHFSSQLENRFFSGFDRDVVVDMLCGVRGILNYMPECSPGELHKQFLQHYKRLYSDSS